MIDLENSQSLNCYRVSEHPDIHAVADQIWELLEVSNRWRSSNRAKKRYANKVLVCNLLDAHRRGRCVRYSRRSNAYTRPARYGALFFAYRTVVRLIDAHRQAGIIECMPGFRVGESGRESRMWLTNLGAELFSQIPPTARTRRDARRELVVLRDSEGALADYDDTLLTHLWRAGLRRYNRLAEATDIHLMDGALLGVLRFDPDIWAVFPDLVRLCRELPDVADLPDAPPGSLPWLLTKTKASITDNTSLADRSLHRVFNNSDWQQGGRFYGAEHQGLPSDARFGILLDGHATTELDFSGMMPRMAYHSLHLECPGDPYDLLPDPESRELVKRALLYALGAASQVSARRAVQRDVNYNRSLRTSLERTGLSVGELMERVEDAHRPIAGLMFQGHGLRVQRQDADIAADVLAHFTHRGIPVLPIHDSFIVPTDHEGELRAVMGETYRSHMGFDCPIR